MPPGDGLYKYILVTFDSRYEEPDIVMALNELRQMQRDWKHSISVGIHLQAHQISPDGEIPDFLLPRIQDIFYRRIGGGYFHIISSEPVPPKLSSTLKEKYNLSFVGIQEPPRTQ